MYCPSCGDEFRAGFTRCGRCEVDLVENLRAAAPPPRTTLAAPPTWIDYCGFLSLDDARRAREDLRGQRIRSEIVVRDAPRGDPAAPVEEEYWLRVDSARIAEVARIIGEEPQAPGPSDTLACSDCGEAVAAEETVCPHCGARFEDAG
jgi:hypothetical protein